MSNITKKETKFSAVANDVIRFAVQIKDAGDFIPAEMRGNPGAIAACMLAGIELGFEPMTSLRVLYVYKGHVGIKPEGMVALLKRHGYEVEWKISTSECATVILTSPTGKKCEMSYTKQDAITAGLWNKQFRTKNGSSMDSTWKLHPKAMLKARCISTATKYFAGDALTGVYSHDEIMEIKERDEQEKVVFEEKEERKSGCEEALKAIENIKEKEEINTISLITEADLILDEMESASCIEDLESCAVKIRSSKEIKDFEKDELRKKYKEFSNKLNEIELQAV